MTYFPYQAKLKVYEKDIYNFLMVIWRLWANV